MTPSDVYDRCRGLKPGSIVELSWADYCAFSDMLIATPLPEYMLGHRIVVDFEADR